MKRLVVTLLFLCGCAFAQYRGFKEEVYPVRAVHVFAADANYSIPDDFLKRTSLNGFNYVILECALDGSDWDRATGKVRTTKSSGKTLRQKMKDAFIKGNSYGIRIIPEFQTADSHSRHWDMANGSIAWNIVGNTADPNSYCTPYAANPPMDLSFDELITAIRDGFKDAALPYPLEYIHIGMDEAIRFDANGSNGVIMLGSCLPDRNFLNTYDANNNGFDRIELENGIRSLMASHIQRRAARIKDICGMTGYGYATKLMVYGDMLDPEHAGGQQYLTPVSATLRVTTYGALSSIPTATRPDVVYIPWMYPTSDYPYYSGNDYDTYGTISTFKAYGAKVVFAHEIGDDCIFNDGIGGLNMSRQNQFKEWLYVTPLKEFRSTILGFAAAPWCSWNGANPSLSFKTEEFLSNEAIYQDAFNN